MPAYGPVQEEGKLPRAEKPSSYNKGQTGAGAKIHGAVTAMKGVAFPHRNDKQARKLRKVWNKATNAASKFGNF